MPDADGVAATFAGSQLLIADGHHRYETAVEFAARDGADRMMVVLVSTSDPGLEVFPTHRVFAGRPDIDLAGEEYPTVEEARRRARRGAVRASAAILVRPESIRLVRRAGRARRRARRPARARRHLVHPPTASEAVRRVESGDADCALLLRPTRIEDVFERARSGEVMPQKTTYFFPKLVSGLLIHPVDP